MTTVTLQTLAVAVGGLVLLATTVSLTRRGLLSLRYGLGWMSVSVAVVAAALLLWLVAPLADLLRMTPTGLMLAAATSFIVTLTLQLSVSLSGQQSAIRDLTEAIALLDSRMQHAEAAVTAAPAVGSSPSNGHSVPFGALAAPRATQTGRADAGGARLTG